MKIARLLIQFNLNGFDLLGAPIQNSCKIDGFEYEKDYLHRNFWCRTPITTAE